MEINVVHHCDDEFDYIWDIEAVIKSMVTMRTIQKVQDAMQVNGFSAVQIITLKTESEIIWS